MIYDDEADAFDLAEDAELAQTLDKAAAKIASRKVGDQRFHDVFAVSGLANIKICKIFSFFCIYCSRTMYSLVSNNRHTSRH